MPKCPDCKCRFRTLEDEQDMHDCPRCGCSPELREGEEDEL